MDDVEKIHLTMSEVGPMDEGIEEVLATGDATWAVRYSDVDIEAEFDGTMGRLMLTADIGVPPEDARQRIYETMLIYSMLWRDTGGVRMSMSEIGGPITQMIDIDSERLTPQMLAIVLHNLEHRTQIWRKFVEGEDVSPLDELEQPSSDDVVIQI